MSFPSTQKALGAGGTLLAVVPASWKYLGSIGAAFKQDTAGPKSDVPITPQAEKDIDDLLRALLPGDQKALAVFVDDLDRCNPAHVVEVIEAINQIFFATQHKQCVFILGMDRQVVAASIDVAYKDIVQELRERGNPLGHTYGLNFLAKIVQMSVALPAPGGVALQALLGAITGGELGPPIEPAETLVQQYAAEIKGAAPANPGDVRRIRREIAGSHQLDPAQEEALREAERQVRSATFTGDSEDLRVAEAAAVALLEPNPRQLKRFDNAFRLQLYVANATHGDELDFHLDQLVGLGKWVALRLRWPGLADVIDQEPALLAALEAAANGEAAAPDLAARYEGWFKDAALMAGLHEEASGRRIAALPFASFLRVV